MVMFIELGSVPLARFTLTRETWGNAVAGKQLRLQRLIAFLGFVDVRIHALRLSVRQQSVNDLSDEPL